MTYKDSKTNQFLNLQYLLNC